VIELLLSGNSVMFSLVTTAVLFEAREHMKAVVVQQSSDLKTEMNSEHTILVIDDDIGFFIAVTSRLMDRALNGRLKKYGVSFGQWPFLMTLWAEEGLTQRELSRRVSNEEATTTRTLDRMEVDGLIRREANITDRRQRIIYLTSKGRSLRDKLVPEALAVSDLTTGQLTPKEVAALRAALKKMVGTLKELSR
jgi:DNA-binding MarR family transcriptional regulator